MYFVFEDEIRGFRNTIIQAKLLNLQKWETMVQWRYADNLPALTGQMPIFQFEVMKVPHPDNYFTGAGLDLYSGRLLRILEQFNIKKELFSVEIRDRKTKALLLEDAGYKVFRLCERHPLIDTTTYKPNRNLPVHEWFLNELTKAAAPAMFMDQTLRNLTFMREDLKLALEQEGITGCSIKSINQEIAGRIADSIRRRRQATQDKPL